MLLTIALLIAAPQTQGADDSIGGIDLCPRGCRDDACVWRATPAYMKGRDAQDRSRGGGFGYAAALLESQRAWLKFRDTECVIEGGELRRRIDAVDDDRRLPHAADLGPHGAAQVADVEAIRPYDTQPADQKPRREHDSKSGERRSSRSPVARSCGSFWAGSSWRPRQCFS